MNEQVLKNLTKEDLDNLKNLIENVVWEVSRNNVQLFSKEKQHDLEKEFLKWWNEYKPELKFYDFSTFSAYINSEECADFIDMNDLYELFYVDVEIESYDNKKEVKEILTELYIENYPQKDLYEIAELAIKERKIIAYYINNSYPNPKKLNIN